MTATGLTASTHRPTITTTNPPAPLPCGLNPNRVRRAKSDTPHYGPDAPRPWGDVEAVELATLSWVHWFNTERLHGHCGHVPPAEFEAAHYAAHQTTPTGAGKPNH